MKQGSHLFTTQIARSFTILICFSLVLNRSHALVFSHEAENQSHSQSSSVVSELEIRIPFFSAAQTSISIDGVQAYQHQKLALSPTMPGFESLGYVSFNEEELTIEGVGKLDDNQVQFQTPLFTSLKITYSLSSLETEVGFDDPPSLLLVDDVVIGLLDKYGVDPLTETFYVTSQVPISPDRRTVTLKLGNSGDVSNPPSLTIHSIELGNTHVVSESKLELHQTHPAVVSAVSLDQVLTLPSQFFASSYLQLLSNFSLYSIDVDRNIEQPKQYSLTQFPGGDSTGHLLSKTWTDEYVLTFDSTGFTTAMLECEFAESQIQFLEFEKQFWPSSGGSHALVFKTPDTCGNSIQATLCTASGSCNKTTLFLEEASVLQ